MGLVADLTSTLVAFIIPLTCILFILSISFIKSQEPISN
jgi:hypothetical protein